MATTQKSTTVMETPSEFQHTSQSELRRRFKPTVSSSQFAGRLGGNQVFIADPNSTDAETLLKKQPDAAPMSNVAQSLDLRGFLVADLWRMALIEGWGTFLLISLLGAIASGLTTIDQSPIAINIYGTLANFVGLALFTFALAPITGAHLNPTISMATFFAGLSTLPRTVLYIVAQSAGSLVAGYWLRLGLGDAYFPKGVIAGCTVDASLVSAGQLFALEYMFAQALILIAFGVGLDPRQGKTLGPAFAPVLVGLDLGYGTLTSGLARPGYTGASLNPARCLGLMTAKQEWQFHYVHWLGPLAAAVLNGIFYHLAPPWARETPLFAGLWNKFAHGHAIHKSKV